FDELGFLLRSSHRHRPGSHSPLGPRAPCHKVAAVPGRAGNAGTSFRRRRWPCTWPASERVIMPDLKTSNGRFGALLGALIAVAVIIFLLNGGEYVGKKTVNGDDDLPPVATGTSNPK